MKELLLDPSSRIADDDEHFGDVLPAADNVVESMDDGDRDYDAEIHQDALDTIEEVKKIPKVSVDLAGRARGLILVLDTMAEINKLAGLIKSHKARKPAAVTKKIGVLVKQRDVGLASVSGLDALVSSGELSRQDADDDLVHIRHGLHETYIGPENTTVRRRYTKSLERQQK